MRIIRFLLKMVVFPIMLIVTVIQWFGAFIIGFSSAVFNVLAYVADGGDIPCRTVPSGGCPVVSDGTVRRS